MDIIFFSSAEEFERWLSRHHTSKSEVYVGFYKVHTNKPTLTWKQSVDAALIHGWIDGVRKRIDEDSYFIRFTPRKKTSIWSKINIDRVKELTKLGRMKPAGLSAFENRDVTRTQRYSFEQEGTIALSKDQERLFRSNKKAWKYFQSMAPSYKKPAIWWVISAKKEETISKRLAMLIADSEAGKKIKLLTRSN